MTNEHSARIHKARALTAALRRAGVPSGLDGVVVAKSLSLEQWKMCSIVAGTKKPSDKTKSLVYAMIEEAAQPVTITTTVNGLDSYAIVVMRGSTLLSKDILAPHEVQHKRNGLCAHWSNHAEHVSANAIPPLPCLREKRRSA